LRRRNESRFTANIATRLTTVAAGLALARARKSKKENNYLPLVQSTYVRKPQSTAR
jgi:hypothetical protein